MSGSGDMSSIGDTITAGYAARTTATDSSSGHHATPRSRRSRSTPNRDDDGVPDVVDPKAIDESLSRQLRQLSFEAHNPINEEIHGVRCLAPEETPEMITEGLHRLSNEIDNIPSTSRLAYDRSQRMFGPSTYVNTADFRLKFLRSELFDARKAAIRLVSFLDLVLDYYGTEALRRPVRLSDAKKEAGEFLRTGYNQLLNVRDRSGRRIISAVNGLGLEFSSRARWAAAIYLMWVAMEDVESQRKGIVFVVTPAPADLPQALPHPKDHLEGRRVFKSMPCRVVAIHFGFPNTYVCHMIRSVVAVVVGTENRLRMKLHSEVRTEFEYALLSYGIPVDQLPVTETGNIKVRTLQQWMRVRKLIEMKRNDNMPTGPTIVENGNSSTYVDDTTSIDLLSDSTIECPGLNDVIFRFGKGNLSHPGNLIFRGLIEAKLEEHTNASSIDEKMEVTWWIVEEIMERRKGRFLTWDNRGWWVAIQERTQIRSKVAASFKEHKKRLKAHNGVQVHESSTYEFERQDGRKRKRGPNGSDVEGCCN